MKTLYGDQKTLEAAGTACVHGALVKADDATVSEVDTLDYGEAELVLTCSINPAPTANQQIPVYVQPLDVDGALDTPDLTVNYKRHLVGFFTPNAVATAQTLWVSIERLPRRYAVWLENLSGQPLAAGWVLKIRPKTRVPL